MMLVVSLVFIDRDLITINHARVGGHDAGCVISEIGIVRYFCPALSGEEKKMS
jgi:hypothetical protein